MKRTPIKRTKSLGQYLAAKQRKPIPKVSPKNKTRVGKLGIVRLTGKELEALRLACFERDSYRCKMLIGRTFVHKRPVFCDKAVTWETGHMAHIRTKRNNGDTLDNVRTLCPDCHRNEHNAGGKPCPPKGGL